MSAFAATLAFLYGIMYMNPKAMELFNMTEQYLQLLPVTAEELEPGTPNIQFIIALNKQLNEQSARIQTMFADIEATNQHPFGYADIMHWKARATYLRNVGQAKKARELERAEALKEAKEADQDEEFIEGYENFLATEFDT